MAITNYADLQSQVAIYLARSDLTTQIPNFIELTEAKLQRRFTGVTSLSSSVTTNWLLTSSPDVYLYGTLLEAQPYLQDDARVQLWAQLFERVVAEVRYPNSSANFTNYTGLKLVIADWLNRPDLTDAIPNFIRLAESQLQRKFLDVTTLSSSVATNWLLTDSPDIYLYATLLESAPYLKDDVRVPLWQAEYDKRIATLRKPTSSGGYSSYTTLKATIADWLDRPDLTNVIPTFITMAQDRLSRDLRLRSMLKVSTALTIAGDKTVGLPTDFLEMRDLHIESNPIMTVSYQSPSAFFRNTAATVSGMPSQYTTLSSELQFAPIPDAEYTLELLYYANPPKLSSTVSTNVFLQNCPDLLLYAALGESAPYLKDDARVATWAMLYDKGVASLSASDDSGEYAGSPLTISIATR